jgi:hypothetical protein
MARIHSPGKDGQTAIPTVGDFVQLLKKHQYSCHKFLHQCCKNGKDLMGWYLKWAKQSASQFRRDVPLSDSDSKIRDAGDLTEPLNDLFSKLPKEQQDEILPILDQHIKYLDDMHASSKRRLEAVLKSPVSKNPAIAKVLASSSNSSSRASSPGPGGEKPATSLIVPSLGPSIDPGPGAYLSRWEDLLDNTHITPLSATGQVKRGEDVNVEKIVQLREGGSGVEMLQEQVKGGENTRGGRPDVEIVTAALGRDFRALLAKRSVYW